jgi:hypothetical protein
VCFFEVQEFLYLFDLFFSKVQVFEFFFRVFLFELNFFWLFFIILGFFVLFSVEHWEAMTGCGHVKVKPVYLIWLLL